jgi:nucleoside-triphosphatase THEP1
MAAITLVTGEIGVGKTTYVTRCVTMALLENRTVAGILSPGIYQSGERIAIWANEPHSGDRYPLAELATATSTGIVTPRWAFDPAAVQRANRSLANIVTADLLVVDELGPLEWHRGEGFVAAFDLIEKATIGEAIAVIRRSLLEVATARWPSANVIEINP